MTDARKPRLRILMVVGNIRATGGMEVQLATLAGALAEGHAVTLISLISRPGDARGPALDPRIAVEDLGARGRLARLAAVPRLAARARSCDVVHCTGWDASLWGRLAAMLARRPVVVAEHAGDRRFQRSASGGARAKWIGLHNRLLDPFTSATVVCATSQRQLLEEEGVAPAKIVSIPNGVPVARMHESAEAGLTRAELGIPAEAKVIVHVASFRAMKRQAVTLETTRRLRDVAGDVRVVFAGDGPELQAVRDLAGDASWAIFLGRQENVAAVLALADLAVLPSIAEAMPMVVIEAIAMGVPVVATAVGDVPDILDRTHAGIHVDSADPEAFYAACLVALTDADRRRTLLHGAASARDEVDASAMVVRYDALLADIVAGSPVRQAGNAAVAAGS